jgi:hypothetical protein
MEEKDALAEIINALAEHEEATSQLYQLYSEQFSDYHDFWVGLASDKLNHAGWIRMLKGGIYAGDVKFKRDRFSLDQISSSIGFIRVQVDFAHRSEVSLMQAFATAVGIEESAMEKGFFNIFEGDAPQLQQILIDVRISMREHCQKIKALYDEIRPGLQWQVNR